MSRFKKIAASSLTAVAMVATAVTAPTATADNGRKGCGPRNWPKALDNTI